VFYLYNFLLTAFMVLALPFFLVKLVTTKKYRQGLTQRLGLYPQEELGKVEGARPFWIHAVSVGESMAAIPLVRELHKRYPRQRILVTTVTATGHEIAKAMIKEADAVLFFPFDVSLIVKRVLDRIRPSLFLLMETEIWPNCIYHLHRLQVPIVVVNGRISQGSYRGYLRVRFLMKKVLGMISSFSMQTQEDADRIIAMGAPSDRVRNSGNIKFDCQAPLPSEADKENLRKHYLLPEGGSILIAGSTHEGEERILIDTYLSLRKGRSDLLLILAPRHPERSGGVEALLREKGLDYQKRSRPLQGKQVLLLDTVGELSRLYAIATVAFVGGSLVPSGGHNILEPAAHGVPVVFGPHMENFQEISAVVRDRHGGVGVRDSRELLAVLEDLLRDSVKRRSMANAARKIIQDNQGALQKTLDLVAGVMADGNPETSGSSPLC